MRDQPVRSMQGIGRLPIAEVALERCVILRHRGGDIAVFPRIRGRIERGRWLVRSGGGTLETTGSNLCAGIDEIAGSIDRISPGPPGHCRAECPAAS